MGAPLGNKNGVGKGTTKRKAWDELSEYIMGEATDRYLAFIATLDDADFADRFEHMLDYFKPKLQRSQLDIATTTERDIKLSFGTAEDPDILPSDGTPPLLDAPRITAPLDPDNEIPNGT
jgi:hypothetical protein